MFILLSKNKGEQSSSHHRVDFLCLHGLFFLRVELGAVHSIDLVDEVSDHLHYFLLVLLVVNVIDACVNGEDGDGIDVAQPLLVPLMHLPQIL